MWRAVVLVAVMVHGHVALAQINATWNGSNNNWTNAGSWSTNPFYPNNGNGAPTYDATIGAGAVNLDIDIALNGLTINGGTLSGSGNLSATNFTLNGGTLTTSGTFTSSHVVLNAGTVGRNLTLTSGSHNIGNVAIGAGSSIINAVGSTLTANATPGEGEGLGPGMLLNQGTFIKTGGSRYYVSMPFNNDGLVQVQQNNLRLNGVGTHSGTFEVSPAAQLELSAAQTFLPTASISGADAGLVLISNTATINSDVSIGYIRMLGGTLAGTGNLHPDQFILDAGTLARNLTLPATASNTIGNAAIGSGFTLTIPVGSTLTAVTTLGEGEGLGPGLLENLGTFAKTGGSRYYASMPFNNDGVVQVLQNNLRLNSAGTHSGTFEVSPAAQLELSGPQTFLPTASISGTGGGVVVISNTATINSDVSVGYIRMLGGTLTGNGNLHPSQFIFDAGTIGRNLTLPTTANNTIGNAAIGSGFTLTIPLGSTLTAVTTAGEGEGLGPGLLENFGTFAKTGGSRYYTSMPFNNDGVVQVLQNNLRLNGVGTHTGTFQLSPATQLEISNAQTFLPGANIAGAASGVVLLSNTATINSEVSVGYVRLLGGTLAGSGNLHPDQFIFDSGTLARDLSLPNVATNSVNSLTIANGSTLTNPTATLINSASGTVNGQGSFVNHGTVSKIGGGTETFATFANSADGAVNVQSGTLALSGVGIQDGTFTVSSGATLTFGGAATSATTLAATAHVGGAGAVRVAQGSLSIPGNDANNYSGGTTVASGGRATITGSGTALGTGTTTIQSGGVVSIEAASNLLSSQAVVQSGGALAVRADFIPVAQIAPSSSGTLAIDIGGFVSTIDMSVLGNGSMSLGSTTTGSYSATSLGTGAGDTYRLGGGGGTLTLTEANVLTGDRPVVISGPGTVILPQSQNYTHGTTIQSGTVAVGSSTSLGSGTMTLQGGGLRANAATVTLNNNYTLGGNFTIDGANSLTLAGAGLLTGNRTLTVSSSATTTISGPIGQDVAGRSLTKSGSGTLVLAADNTFTGGLTVNGGSLVIATDQHYGGATTVDLGATLDVEASLLTGGGVTVRGGATLAGGGTVGPSTTIAGTGLVSPGHSSGQLTFTSGLALQNGSHDIWQLSALGTANPGTDWDRINLTGGQLAIANGARLDIAFTAAAVAPDFDVAFLHGAHRWDNILNLTGTATNPTGFVDFIIDNSSWSALGSFDALPAESGLGVDLAWVPAPEPEGWVMMALAIAAFLLSKSSAITGLSSRRLAATPPQSPT